MSNTGPNDLPPIDVEHAEASPLHGYQGDRLPFSIPRTPAGPSIAISREVGARGGPIARRVGQKLGWQVFDRELIEFMLQDNSVFDSLLAEAPPGAAEWVNERLAALVNEGRVIAGEAERLAKLILAIGSQGNVVLVGRGAGYLLPSRTTLHVMINAPFAERVAYMSQWLRLPTEEAADQVRIRSARRVEFLAACFRLPPGTITHDMILNSSRLGVELCADLIIQAMRGRMAMPTVTRPTDEPPS
jgi:hypothetical protein